MPVHGGAKRPKVVDDMTTALGAIFSRAIGLIEEENAALARAEPADHMAIATQKNMILFELGKLERTLPRAGLDRDALHQLALLRSKLAVNRSLLDVHIAAANEIVRILSAINRAAESDGTYSIPFAVQGKLS